MIDMFKKHLTILFQFVVFIKKIYLNNLVLKLQSFAQKRMPIEIYLKRDIYLLKIKYLSLRKFKKIKLRRNFYVTCNFNYNIHIYKPSYK